MRLVRLSSETKLGRQSVPKDKRKDQFEVPKTYINVDYAFRKEARVNPIRFEEPRVCGRDK